MARVGRLLARVAKLSAKAVEATFPAVIAVASRNVRAVVRDHSRFPTPNGRWEF
jgi:hypothetical protein